MRISGLASGMDIDSIVSDMMKIKKMPLDKLKQEKQVMEWQRDDYREMNTLLLNFRSELTQMKLTTKYRTRTTTTTDDSKVTATASSAASLSSFSISEVKQLATAATKVNYDSISKAGSTIDPTASLFTIQKNFHLGNNFDWASGSVESKMDKFTSDTDQYSLGLKDGVKIKSDELKSMNVSVNGTLYEVVTGVDPTDLEEKQVLVDEDGNLKFGENIKKDSVIKVDYIADTKVDNFTLSEETNSISLTRGSVNSGSFTVKNQAGKVGDYVIVNGEIRVNNEDGEVAGSVDSQGKITMKDEFKFATNSTVEVKYTQNYLDFNIQTHTSKGKVSQNFHIQGSDSLNAVINKVNGSDAGVSMFYDSYSNKMTLTRTETGNFRGLDSSDEGFSKSDNEIITSGRFINEVLRFSAGTETGGENAIFTINGLETQRNSNRFDINGVSFTLKKTFGDSETAEPPVTIAINNDSTAVYENIKKFIDSYNELISKIQGEVQEERFRGYAPLSDEQRESLSDKQQEQWEEKAKSGLLRRDSTLSSLLSSMRMDFYGTVESDDINPIYNQLAKIGIKTTANYLEGGKLEINEAQLKKAIEADPESVESLFNASGTTNGQKGIAQRLYDTVGKTMDILTEKAGKSYSTSSQFTIGRQLESLEDQIDRFEDRMIQLEDRYYRQFTAMEKMIAQANQQSAYIMNNFFA